jgi:hypothetical protein
VGFVDIGMLVDDGIPGIVPDKLNRHIQLIFAATPSRSAVISGPRAMASVQLKQEMAVLTGFSSTGRRSMVMV